MIDDDIQATVTGSLVADSVLRETRAGKPWQSFTVIVQSGHEKTWVSVALFGDAALEISPKLVKGRRVAVTGRLTLRRWIGNDGRDKAGLSLATTEVELLAAGSGKRLLQQRKPTAKLQDYAKPRATDPRASAHCPVGSTTLTPEQQAIPSFE